MSDTPKFEIKRDALQVYTPRKYKGGPRKSLKQERAEAFEQGRRYERELLRGIIDQALR